MKDAAFSCQVHGKFIVSGEHSVLRGAPALVFPLKGRRLLLRYEAVKKPLEIRSLPEGQVEIITSGLLDKALGLLEHKKEELQGILWMENSIPVGTGLGASAALCVSVSRFLEWKGWLNSNQLYEFARELENLFHGESSGVDIAVALSNEPIVFERISGSQETFEPRWKPNWTLSYSGQRGLTIDAISKVKMLMNRDPSLAKETDERMAKATKLACEALRSDKTLGLPLLAQAISLANECFRTWGLTDGLLNGKMDELMSRGAMAVKPTGSGAGGYVLALWREDPPADLDLVRV